MNFTYEAPRRLPRFVRGWQLAGSGRMSTGRPFTVRVANVQIDKGEANRPDRIANGALANPTPERWFDPTAFVTVPTGGFRFGNSGRNILDAPGIVGVNLSLSRRIHLQEKKSLQFRWEAFNFLNRANFGLA